MEEQEVPAAHVNRAMSWVALNKRRTSHRALGGRGKGSRMTETLRYLFGTRERAATVVQRFRELGFVAGVAGQPATGSGHVVEIRELALSEVGDVVAAMHKHAPEGRMIGYRVSTSSRE